MKFKFLLSFTLILALSCNLNAQTDAQDQNVQFGSGYAVLKLQANDSTFQGFTINFSYEKFIADKHSIGASCNVVRVRTHTNYPGIYKEVPFTFNTKYYIGANKFKGFLKGMVGCHLVRLTIDDPDEVTTTTTAGFAAGGGAGAIYTINDHLILNLDYSLFWLSNSDYSNGLVHTVNLNVGYVF